MPPTSTTVPRAIVLSGPSGFESSFFFALLYN